MPICFVVHLFITIVNDGYLLHLVSGNILKNPAFLLGEISDFKISPKYKEDFRGGRQDFKLVADPSV